MPLAFLPPHQVAFFFFLFLGLSKTENAVSHRYVEENWSKMTNAFFSNVKGFILNFNPKFIQRYLPVQQLNVTVVTYANKFFLFQIQNTMGIQM